MKTLVIALGGNAILKKGESPSIETQEKNIQKAASKLFPLIKNNKAVISHGNGPQSGYLLLKQNAPLDVIDAETEGQIGYLIQQEIFNLFRKHKIKRGIATILTQVLVDKNDLAFKNPGKFVGPFYSESEAEKLKNKFIIKKDSDRGFRRVVPSPKPIKIIESDVIKKMLQNQILVIAAGGGGIPVIEKNKELHGIEAVIDKDLASACLANSIKADELIIITDIDGAYLNFRKTGEKKLKIAKLNEIKNYYAQGHFPAGSMGPKIEAAIDFLSSKGKKVIITNIENINDEKRGTVILK